MISRTISAFTFAVALAAAAAVAAPADSAAVKAADTGAAKAKVEFPSEKGRIIVADTLKFPWPPADSAARAGAKSVFADTVKAFSADTSDFIDTPPVKPEAPAVDAQVPAVTAPAPEVKRPRTRQDLSKMSREELFRLAFGRAAPEKPRNLTVRLFGEGRPVGSTEIAYNEDFTAFTFRSMALSRLLDRMILPEARDAAGDSLGHFSSDIMEAAGYKFAVDDVNFELRVSFPPEDKGVQFTDLYGGYRTDEPRGDEIPAANVSFYVNYSVEDRARYIMYGDFDAGAIGRDAAAMNAEGALNIRRWVFESSGWVREPYAGEAFTWENVRRDDARVVREFTDTRSQLIIGDISAGTSIMSGPMSGGARYERNSYFFGNDPQSVQNSVTFFMPEAGEVEVYIEGAFRRRFRLPAGHHRVGGFGGTAGRNRVRLLLRMENGSTEDVPFEYLLSNPRVMTLGDTRYAFTAGVRREYAPSPACFNYYLSEPVASADYAYGIHRAINAGFAAVASRHAGQGGAQLSFDIGGLGFVDARAVASYLAAERLAGWRAEGSYTADLKRPVARFNRFVTRDPNKTLLPQLSFAMRGYYQTESYSLRMFNEPFTDANGSVSGASGNLAMALWRGSLSAFGGVNFYRETGFEAKYYPYDYNYGARFSQGFGRSYFSVSGGESVRGGVRSPYFMLNSNHAFGTDFRVRGHRFSAAASAGMNTRYIPTVADDSIIEISDSVEIDWAYGGTLGWSWSNDATGAGTQAYTANARFENDLSPAAAATMRHSYNRARLNADYDFLLSDYQSYGRQNHAMRAELTGSVMFADGLWAMGQQVSSGGGFVLVNTQGDLADAKVHINRSRTTGGETSRSGWLGAAYHNRVMAYSPTELTLNLTNVPAGAFLEQSRYYVTGTYKQGYALSIGKQAQVIAIVPFVDKRGGKPLSHTYLTITQEDADEDAVQRAAFTSEDGILQIGGITPGYTYRVKFRASSRLKDALIEIPSGAYGMYEHPVVEVDRED